LIVVVAGRVSTSPDTIGCCEAADWVDDPDVPEVDVVVVVPEGRCVAVLCPLAGVVDDVDDWAETPAAPAITMASAIATRFTIRSASYTMLLSLDASTAAGAALSPAVGAD
jgi:hypothetical protein